MKDNKSSSIFRRYWLAVFLAAGLGYAFYYILGLVGDVDREVVFSWPPLLWAFVLQLCFWGLSSYLWKGLLENFSQKRMSFLDCFFQLCLVNIGKYFPGKVWGMVARGSYLRQRYAVSSQAIVQTTYVEQVFLVGSGVSLACVLYGAMEQSLLLYAVALVLAFVTITGSTHLQAFLKGLDRLVPRLALAKRFDVSDNGLTFSNGLWYFIRYGLVWTILGAVLYAICLSLFPSGFDLRNALVTILSCIVGFTAGFLAIFAPGGLGVREAVSSTVLSRFMPWADAVMLTLVFRIWLTSFELAAMGLSSLIVRRAWNRSDDQPGGDSPRRGAQQQPGLEKRS